MIIIGHYAIKHRQFVKINSIDEIVRTKQDCVLWFDSTQDKDFAIAAHCHKHHIDYAVMIDSIENLLLYAALFPMYLILPKSLQKDMKAYQNIIEHYLLDCKLLCVITSTKQLTKIAQVGIDGVIFKQVLDTISAS